MGNFLPTKVAEGIETACVVEMFLILTITAFHLSIVAGDIGADELMTNFQLCGRCLKKVSQVILAIGKAIGKLKAIVSLAALDKNAFTGKIQLILRRNYPRSR